MKKISSRCCNIVLDGPSVESRHHTARLLSLSLSLFLPGSIVCVSNICLPILTISQKFTNTFYFLQLGCSPIGGQKSREKVCDNWQQIHTYDSILQLAYDFLSAWISCFDIDYWNSVFHSVRVHTEFPDTHHRIIIICVCCTYLFTCIFILYYLHCYIILPVHIYLFIFVYICIYI